MPATELHEVAAFWNEKACGEVYAVGDSLRQQLLHQSVARYALEPYIFDFARFRDGYEKDVLEIGVGMGADHLEWAKAEPKLLSGIDLTERAAELTTKRLLLEGRIPIVMVANAEELPFRDESFDIVYSWGVLHHSANPPRAINEAFRVLRPGGIARVMIYHKYSLTGLMLWLKYGAFRESLERVYAEHLESPGTHAYSNAEARAMFSDFSAISIVHKLSPADLLEGQAGQRHTIPEIIKKLWPRWLLKMFPWFGLFMLIEARKP